MIVQSMMPSAASAAALPVEPAAFAPAVPPEDVTKFEAALVPPRPSVQDLDSVPPALEPAVATPDTMGERILASVDRMRVEYKAGMERMDVSMRKDPIGMPEVMRVMVDAMQMSLQTEMLSKMVGRATQNVDQLLKGQ